MNIFLGSVYPKELLEELINRKEYVDFPGQTFQQSLLKGLLDQINFLRIVTSPVIRSERNKVIDLCDRREFSYIGSEKKEDIYVGTSVIPGVQMISEFVRVFLCLRRLFKSSPNNLLIIYALHSPFLLAAVLLRKRISCSCVIVPDLPEYMSRRTNAIKLFGKWIDRKVINFCIKRLDSYVLLSPYMRERLPIANKPWTLMEGIYNEEIVNKECGSASVKEKIILYTGNLSSQTGITDLLAAFRQIESPNYRLWIRGNGVTKDDVLKAQEVDTRIKYFEPMPIEELRKLQRQATVLINPVRPSNEFTKYFFPSKTMEYLASGTPTIMYKLPCLPEDYYSHLFFVEKETIESLKEKIIEVCEKPQQELNEFGAKASEFIKTKKNAYIQAQKVVDMICQFRKVEKTSFLKDPMTWIKMALAIGALLSIWAIGAIDLNILPLISMTDGIFTSAGLNKVFIGLSYSYLAGIFVYFLTVPFPQYAYRRKIKSVLEKNINEIGSSLHNMLIDFCGGDGEARNPNLNDLDDCRDLLINYDWSSMTVIPSHIGRRRAQAFKDELDLMLNHINIFVNDYKDVLSEEQLILLENIRHTSLGSFVGFGLPLLTSDFSIQAKKMLAEQFCDLARWYQQLKKLI